MNVSFLNSLYRPSKEELQKLHKMQEVITYSRRACLYEVREQSPNAQKYRLQQFHKTFRDQWKVLSNEIEELEEDDFNPENNTPLS